MNYIGQIYIFILLILLILGFGIAIWTFINFIISKTIIKTKDNKTIKLPNNKWLKVSVVSLVGILLIVLLSGYIKVSKPTEHFHAEHNSQQIQ